MGEIWNSGFTNAKPCYSLGYSQGDGACFGCDEFDFDLLLKGWEHKHKQWFINILKNHCEVRIVRNRFSNHYSHSKTRNFEILLRGGFHYEMYERIEKTIEDAEKYIENLRYELSENLTDRLYEQLEYLRSDEQIAEGLIANEYYFNGETLEIEYC